MPTAEEYGLEVISAEVADNPNAITRFVLVALPGVIGAIVIFDLNPWAVRRDDVDRPDELRVDLDPQPGVPYADVLRAVSYTHLRAHETVLDLVCRLLLEKKKKHTLYSTITH